MGHKELHSLSEPHSPSVQGGRRQPCWRVAWARLGLAHALALAPGCPSASVASLRLLVIRWAKSSLETHPVSLGCSGAGSAARTWVCGEGAGQADRKSLDK